MLASHPCCFIVHATARAAAARGQALVVVIDASDVSRIGVVRDEVRRVTDHADVKAQCHPILVFLNKTDLASGADREALTVAHAQSLIGADTLRTRHEVKVQPCCAITGAGVDQGFQWLSERVR